ncbi:MAG: PA14 domain-containing protein [Cyanobacteria bacterium P01_E01_bin.42]
MKKTLVLLMSVLLAIACWGIAPTSASAETPQGFKADYFNNQTLSGGPVLTRIDETINTDWGYGTPAPDVVNPDHFSARWVGTIIPEYTESYTFTTTSSDGIRLWIDDEKIIEDWNDTPISKSASKDLIAGKRYNIRVEYYEISSGATAILVWSSPSQAKEAVVAYPERTISLDSTNIVNIDSTENLTPDKGVKVTLPAADYAIGIIGKKDGGEYDAWSKNSRTEGCDENGLKCQKGWEHKYFYKLSDAKPVKVDRTGLYETAEQAIAHPASDVTFTLTEETEISFFVKDPKNPANNQGGVSLQLGKIEKFY